MKEKMMFILLVLSLLSLIWCQYKKLEKHSSVIVNPYTQVFLDLSSFKTDDIISLKIVMNLFLIENKKPMNFL